MTASVLARPEEGRQRAGRPSTRGPVAPARRTPGPRGPVWLDSQASVQFAAEPFWFRVVRTEPAATCDGWVWLHGYQLDAVGDAVARRSVLVVEAALYPELPVHAERRLPDAPEGGAGAVGGLPRPRQGGGS